MFKAIIKRVKEWRAKRRALAAPRDAYREVHETPYLWKATHPDSGVWEVGLMKRRDAIKEVLRGNHSILAVDDRNKFIFYKRRD